MKTREVNRRNYTYIYIYIYIYTFSSLIIKAIKQTR